MDDLSFRDALSNAIKYWERMRIFYNAVLILIVVGTFIHDYPGSKAFLKFGWILVLFLFAVGANVVYCAAYFVDIPVQMSQFREKWVKIRWILLVVGTACAGILAYFWSLGFFQPNF
jgi:hypothetical protein